MKRSSFSAFLVVEGINDKRVYGLVIDNEGCSIEIAHGRDNALGAVRILNADNFSGVLGIVDADFANVTGETMPEDNILETDFHDLECMMLNSPAFDRMLEEFGSDVRVAAFAENRPLIARELARSAVPLGCLALISLQQGLGPKFEGLTFSRFVEPNDLQIDLAKMVREVVNNSQQHHIDQTRLLDQVVIETRKGHDCWQISRGHDIVEILSFAFRKTFSRKSSGEVAPETLQRCLRLAYDVAYFKQTSLYQAMNDWEKDHPKFPILDRSNGSLESRRIL
jgi:hypothetical protein